MDLHGDAIYGTQPSPYEYEFDWGRMTTKGDRVFLFVYQWPAEKLVLHGIRNRVKRAYIMSTPGKEVVVGQSYSSRLDVHTLELEMPKRKPAVMVPVIVLELDQELDVDSRLVQQENGEIILPSVMAQVHAIAKNTKWKGVDSGNAIAAVVAENANEVTISNKICVGVEGMVQKWFSTQDWIHWEFTADRVGSYKIELHTVAPKYVKWKGGHEVSVSIGRQTVTRKVRADKKIDSPRTFHFEERVTRLGTLEIEKPGKTVLKLKASQINRAVTNGLCVSEIRLVP